MINPYIENEIIPIRYKSISTLFDKYYIVQNTESENGLFLENGEKVLNEEYKFYNVFKKTIFATRNNKPLLINLEDAKYSEKETFVEEFVSYKDEQEYSRNSNQIFKSQGKFGVINYENKIVIPCEYESIENIYLSKEFVVKTSHH